MNLIHVIASESILLQCKPLIQIHSTENHINSQASVQTQEKMNHGYLKYVDKLIMLMKCKVFKYIIANILIEEVRYYGIAFTCLL